MAASGDILRLNRGRCGLLCAVYRILAMKSDIRLSGVDNCQGGGGGGHHQVKYL